MLYSLTDMNTAKEDIVIEQSSLVYAKIPAAPISERSIQVSTHQGKEYSLWDEDEHKQSYQVFQKIATLWNDHQGDQYLIYGKVQQETPFHWEMIPFHKSWTLAGRILQQFRVFLEIVFGSSALSQLEQENYAREYRSISDAPNSVLLTSKKISCAVLQDAFCSETVIQKQQVFEGKEIRVLYNYAPIGFGSEKLHFLVVSKEHRPTFRELTEQEYEEANKITRLLIDRISQTRTIQDVYLFHKSGADAGQSVPHWHMHVIFSTSKMQDFLSKLTFLKSMIFGTTPMNDKELYEKVSNLRNELTKLE